jgi:hypothetical protein
MSPENLSYSIAYQVPINITRPPWPLGEIMSPFLRARDGLYMCLRTSTNYIPNRALYNVQSLSTALWSPEVYSDLGDLDNGSVIVDDNDRIWYMGNVYLGDQTMLYGHNINTGARDFAIDTGIPYPWGNQYYYPITNRYRQLIIAEDSILVFSHNTYQPAYQGRPLITAQNTFIYKVT